MTQTSLIATTTSDTARNSKHKRRWRLLRTAILHKRLDASSASSTTLHSGFHMLSSKRTRCWSIPDVYIILDDHDNDNDNDDDQPPPCSMQDHLVRIRRLFEHADEISVYGYGKLSTVCASIGAQYQHVRIETCAPRGRPRGRPRTNNRHHKGPGLMITIRRTEQHQKSTSNDDDDYDRVEYTLPSHPHVVLVVRERQQQHVRLNLKELLSHQQNDGVDNTGNVRVWPSEEVLSYWCLTQHHIRLKNRTICELGAGMTGLAGLACSTIGASSVLLTDGNPNAVENLSICINATKQRNPSSCSRLAAKKLRWDRNLIQDQVCAAYGGPFDMILAADCVFFENFHIDLLHTITCLLSSSGRCILMQPRRGKSLDNFLHLAKHQFEYCATVHDGYSQRVDDLHKKYQLESSTYQPDLHYPVLIELSRSSV